MFFLLTPCKSYSGKKTNTEENYKTKIKKQDIDEDGDSEIVIGKAPPENKNILFIFCDGSAKSSACDEKC